jgi:outer membrane receptor protein involved in Fe transport
MINRDNHGAGRLSRRSGLRTLSSALALTVAFLAEPAIAQSDAAVETGALPETPEATPQQAEITVTGSRIARRDLTADTPIVTLGADRLLSAGQPTIERTIAQLPQFGLGENSTQTGFATTGQATLNLRALGSARNLVLLDGRRLQPSNIQQVVDVNTLPLPLLESVEVITGGASAAYGSDAVAGVVNFRTRRNFEGLQIDASYNIAGEGDGAVRDISGTLGGNFADGRGNAVLSVGYTERDSVGYQSRPFFQRNQGGTDLRLPIGVYAPGGNAPTQAAINDLFATYGVAPGSVVRTSGLALNQDGSVFSASNGVFNFRGDWGSLLFNTGRQVNNLNQFLVLQAPLNRITAFGRITYDLTPGIEAYAQAQYVDYDTHIFVEPGNTSLSIPIGNPFIPQVLRPLLASRANPLANVTLEKRFIEAGPRLTDRSLQTYQFLGGLRGNVTSIDGTWDVYASHGRTRISETSPGSVLISALNTLINAPDGGNSICAGGYNPFGVNPLSEACYNYLVASPTRDTGLTQTVAEANVQGRLFHLFDEDVRFAAGASFRRNGYETVPDRILAAGDVVGVQYTRFSEGTTEVWEGYAELLIPILSNRPFAESLGIDLAYRYSDYNVSGGAHTWKAEGHWSPFRGLRFRGGYARAVRAPSVGELYVAPSGSVPSIGQPSQGQGDYCSVANPVRTGPNAAGIRALCLAQGVPLAVIDTFVNLQNDSPATLVGNPDLDPEVADTFTAGFTFTPPTDNPFFSGLSLSVDYYNIKVAGAIGVYSSLQSVTSCFNIDGANPTLSPTNEFCSYITRDPLTGRISDIRQPTRNLGAFRTSGVDVALRWSVPLGGGGDRLTLDANLTWLDSFTVQTAPGRPFLEYAGTVGGTAVFQPGSLPEWKAVTELNYQHGGFSVGGRWRFLDAMRSVQRVVNPASTTPGVPSYNLFDLFASLRVSGDFVLRLGVNNVANREPPVLNGVIGTTEASTYDVLGRTFYVSTRVNF